MHHVKGLVDDTWHSNMKLSVASCKKANVPDIDEQEALGT